MLIPPKPFAVAFMVILASVAMVRPSQAQARWLDLEDRDPWSERDDEELSGWRASFDTLFTFGFLAQDYEDPIDPSIDYETLGLGPGLSARIALQYLSVPQSGERQSWLGAYLAGGFNATGLFGVRNRIDWQNRGETGMGMPGGFGMLALPLAVGFNAGAGSKQDERWRGFAWGLGYAPALTVVPHDSLNAVEFSWAGFELTLDPSVELIAGEKTSSSRIRAHVMIPTRDEWPLILSLGYGWVWY